MGMSEAWLQEKFNTLGYGSAFDLVGRVGTGSSNAFRVRCRACDCEFNRDRWYITHGRRLICPDCGAASTGAPVLTRTDTATEALAYYTAGHSVMETATAFGLSEIQVNNLVKRAGVTNGRSFCSPENSRKGSQAAAAKARQAALEKIPDIVRSWGYEYIGGYENNRSMIEVRCPDCGGTFLLNYHNAKQRKAPECRSCAQIRKDQAVQERLDRKKAAEDLRRMKQEAEDLLLTAKTHTCVVCGKAFSVLDYMTDCGLREVQHNPSCCSEACKRKMRNAKSKEWKRRKGVRDSHRHRAIKYGCEYDPSVTLKALIARDGLRCAICGEMCDPNDRSWSAFCGSMSPSIDHIVPMAKKGGHTWDNVQVAHIICNSEKGDRLQEEVIE